jgi:hypothetical protein
VTCGARIASRARDVHGPSATRGTCRRPQFSLQWAAPSGDDDLLLAAQQQNSDQAPCGYAALVLAAIPNLNRPNKILTGPEQLPVLLDLHHAKSKVV